MIVTGKQCQLMAIYITSDLTEKAYKATERFEIEALKLEAERLGLEIDFEAIWDEVKKEAIFGYFLNFRRQKKMKNIHVLSTEKPSRLVKLKIFGKDKYNLSKEILPIQDEEQYQNSYITSDEEIKVNDYITDGYLVWKWKDDSSLLGRKKVITTTDQDLIKDGVQAIDDEFLEWFVKNPSCEEVKIELQMLCDYCGQEHCDNLRCRGYKDSAWYEIIIPKEPKQETLEEAAEKYAKQFDYAEDSSFSKKTNNLFKADDLEHLESHNMIEDFDKSFYINSKYAKKIILTTDVDLIKDGIQSIDDEFLEWFIKNPSCEEVKWSAYPISPNGNIVATNRPYPFEGLISNFKIEYKIITPKEEPKQETLEEAAEKFRSKNPGTMQGSNNTKIINAFKNGAKSDAAKAYWYNIFKQNL